MLQAQTYILGELQTNCYLVWESETKNGVIIDPADEGEFLAEEVQAKGIKLNYILATHGHFDHILGALALKLIFDCPFGCSCKDEFLLKRQKETAKYFLGREIEVPNFSKIDIDLETAQNLKIGRETIEIIKTPGHTPGGVCFYSKENKILFSGDTLFYGSYGRIDFKYASEEEMKKSLKKLSELPKQTRVFPGHGADCLLETAF